MIWSVAEFTKTALAFLLFTWLGAAGAVTDAEISDHGILARSSGQAFAVGDVAYYQDRNKNHEYGHLVHEDELGIFYLPIAGLTSLIGNLWMRSRYYNLWTESMANYYGGVLE
jgi:hypothetical protein